MTDRFIKLEPVVEFKVIKESEYILKLTEKEFKVLSSLVGIVSGSLDESEYRRVINKLWKDFFKEEFKKDFKSYLDDTGQVIIAPEGNLP